MASAAVSAAAYAKAGDRKQAVLMAASVGAAAIGAAGAVKAYQAAKSVKATATIARLGKVDKLLNSAGKQGLITGYRRHAIGRTAGTRDANQLSPQAVKLIVKKGKKTYDAGRAVYNYDHFLGRVGLNTRGHVVTVISKTRYGRYVR